MEKKENSEAILSVSTIIEAFPSTMIEWRMVA